MAFLDNSGDIVLDAVLTDTGRMRMAAGDGSFKIVKFALGDDEIDYTLYNKNQELNLTHYTDINSAINSTIKILNKQNNKRIFKTFAVRSKNTFKIHQIVKKIEQVYFF